MCVHVLIDIGVEIVTPLTNEYQTIFAVFISIRQPSGYVPQVDIIARPSLKLVPDA